MSRTFMYRDTDSGVEQRLFNHPDEIPADEGWRDQPEPHEKTGKAIGDMTKAELLKYASDLGFSLDQTKRKADLISDLLAEQEHGIGNGA